MAFAIKVLGGRSNYSYRKRSGRPVMRKGDGWYHEVLEAGGVTIGEATRYGTREEAETAALLLVAKRPHWMGKVQVVRITPHGNQYGWKEAKGD